MTGARSAWVNGELVDASAATIPLMSAAVFRGTSVFDVMLVVDGPYAVGLDAHLARLFRSAAEMGHRVGVDADALRSAAVAVTAGQATPTIVRTVIADAGSSGRSGDGPHTIVAMTSEPAELTTTPLRLVSAHTKIAPEVLPVDIKVAAIYAAGLRRERSAIADGADGIINFGPDGRLLEAVSASVAVVDHGRLRLPPLTEVLDSVTRRLVVAVAEANGIDVVIESIPGPDVRAAHGLLLASATRPVVPVAQLDDVSYDPDDETVMALQAGVGDVLARRHPLAERWLSPLW